MNTFLGVVCGELETLRLARNSASCKQGEAKTHKKSALTRVGHDIPSCRQMRLAIRKRVLPVYGGRKVGARYLWGYPLQIVE
jgi:hypothetical protein